jgi:maleylacetoacetate isomerase
MEKFILYNYFRSSTSYRVRIALNLKSIPFDYKPIHLLNNGGEQHSETYKKINPSRGVPTLVHEIPNQPSRTIAQSMAIIEYIDEIRPEPISLFPKSVYEKAIVRQMCECINADMHNFSNLKVLQYIEAEFKNLTTAEKAAELKDKWLQNWMKRGFESFEQLLSQHSGKFSFGDQISAIDTFLVSHHFTAVRFNVDLSSYPNLNRINKTCIEIEAFKKAHPSQQIDTPPG